MCVVFSRDDIEFNEDWQASETLREKGRRLATNTGPATGRVVARMVAWIEDDGTVVLQDRVRCMPEVAS